MNEEFDELQDEILDETLDSPLVVHKKGDASYKEGTPNIQMNETHLEEDKPTLVRHRFKKEPGEKKSKLPLTLIVIVILACVFCVLYLSGYITFDDNNSVTESTTATTTTELSLEEQYKGTIVIKNTYIFVNGVEVDGIQGLQDALRYEDKSSTAFTIIDEGANSAFLNDEILPIMMDMGFYDQNTKITHQGYTGLMAANEQTTVATTVSETSTTQVNDQ